MPHPKQPYPARIDLKKYDCDDEKFSFNNSDDLIKLVKSQLKKDFNLTIDFPKNCLIPRLPSRLNYLLLIDDILLTKRQKLKTTARAAKILDIGTGASCIYPLLGLRSGKFMQQIPKCDPVQKRRLFWEPRWPKPLP